MFSGVGVSTRPNLVAITQAAALSQSLCIVLSTSSSGVGGISVQLWSPVKHSPTTAGVHCRRVAQVSKRSRIPLSCEPLITHTPTPHPGQCSREPSGQITNTQPRPIPSYLLTHRYCHPAASGWPPVEHFSLFALRWNAPVSKRFRFLTVSPAS